MAKGSIGTFRTTPVPFFVRSSLSMMNSQQLLDLTKGNPLLGINRSRVSKLKVIAPTAAQLWTRFAVGDEALRLPLIARRAAEEPSDEPGRPIAVAEHYPDAHKAEPEYTVRPGDLTFEGQPVDLFRRRWRRGGGSGCRVAPLVKGAANGFAAGFASP